MSGPIIRKYGFPNFEKIFGERALEHGVDDERRARPTKSEKEARAATSRRTVPQAQAAGQRNRRSNEGSDQASTNPRCRRGRHGGAAASAWGNGVRGWLSSARARGTR